MVWLGWLSLEGWLSMEKLHKRKKYLFSNLITQTIKYYSFFFFGNFRRNNNPKIFEDRKTKSLNLTIFLNISNLTFRLSSLLSLSFFKYKISIF